MEKIKRIVSSGRKHGEEYLDHNSASSRGNGVSASDSTARGSTQATSGGSGNATTDNTATGYPTGSSAAGYTAINPQGNATTANTSSYGNSGTTTAGQTATGYPVASGYTSTGNNAPITTGSGYSRDNASAGQYTSGYNTTGNTAAGSNTAGYQTTGNTTAQSGATENSSGLGSDGRRISKGPNEGTSITSGLGSRATPGSGNTHVEDGLTRGFQTTGAAENATGTSHVQTGLTGRDYTSTNTGYQNISTGAISGERDFARNTAGVGTGSATAAGTHLHRQTVKDTETGASTTGTGQRLGHDIVGAGTSGQGSHLHRQTARENLGSDAGYTTPSVDPSSKQHLGRDAAVLGGVGAAGAGVYHYRQNENEAVGSSAGYTGSTPGASGAYTAPYGTAIPGPHATNAANISDPAVNTTGKGHVEDSHDHSRSRGSGGESADKFDSKKKNGGGATAAVLSSSKKTKNQGSGVESTSSSSSSYDTDPSTGRHPGKDRAMGAGLVGAGAGAAGIAGHEYSKHGSGTGATAGTTTGADSGAKTSTGTSSGRTSGAYETATTSSSPKLGKNAAMGAAGLGAAGLGAAGLGAAGLGAAGLAHGRDESGKATTSDAAGDSPLEGPAPHTAGPHKYDWMNKLDPRVDANPDASQSTAATDNKLGSVEGDQHYGRNAAVGAGIGGIGGAAYASSKQKHSKTDSGVAGITPTATKDQYDPKTTGTSEQKYSSQYTTDQNTRAPMTTTTTSTGATGYKGAGTEPAYQTTSAADQTSGHHYGRDAAIAGGGVAALGGAAVMGEQQYQKHERAIPLVGKGDVIDVNDEPQSSMGTTGATGAASTSHTGTGTYGTATATSDTTTGTYGTTTGTTGLAGKPKSNETADPYRYDTYGLGTTSLPDRTKEQHHYGRDAAIGAGSVGGVGLVANELRKNDDAGYSGISTAQSSGQQRTTGASGTEAYGTGTDTAKQSATQQQYEREPAIAGGVASSQGTSKQHYRTLSSGTPSGVFSTQFGSNVTPQFGSNVSGSNASGKFASNTSGQFGSNAPAPSSQYASNTSGLKSTMPGTFPVESYDNPVSSTQGTTVAGVGAGAGMGSQYTTSKHGPTTVASDESGHSKLHKEPHSESLASTIKHKLGI